MDTHRNPRAVLIPRVPHCPHKAHLYKTDTSLACEYSRLSLLPVAETPAAAESVENRLCS